MKCSKENGFCKTLEERLEMACHHGKGLIPVSVIRGLDTPKHEIECIGVKYATSSKDKGVMLNFCPFCGEKIAWYK